jgi:hypothetical protein
MIISKLREMLHDSIQKHGLTSEKTYKLSVELDEAIVDYYKNSSMLYYYEKSLDGLKKFIKDNNHEPNKKEWNTYAKENNFLSSESMKYIGNINFK